MTPKEKAIELLELFESKEHAVMCASITLGALVDYGESSFDLQNMEQDIRWWDKVIDEIKIL